MSRHNKGKLRYDLIHPISTHRLAEVLTEGAKKYDARNWETGMNWTTMLASLKRHLAAFESGIDFDEESKLLHMAHVLANAHMLCAYYDIAPQFDDRPTTHRTGFDKLFYDGVSRITITPLARERMGKMGYDFTKSNVIHAVNDNIYGSLLLNQLNFHDTDVFITTSPRQYYDAVGVYSATFMVCEDKNENNIPSHKYV